MEDCTLYESIPVPAKGTMARKETFGVMLAGGNLPILNLNEDAAAIWELFDGRRSIREIESELQQNYDEDAVQRTLPEFIHYCVHAGFITLREP